jgi:hypothetical protein
MLKKNKALLKKIYKEEYEKALAKEKQASLSREIDRIKKYAREKARRKAMSRAERMKHTRGLSKNTKRTVRHYGDVASKINKNLMDLL